MKKLIYVYAVFLCASTILLSSGCRPSPAPNSSAPYATTTTTAAMTTTITTTKTTTTATTTVPTTTTTAVPDNKVIRNENSVHIQAPLLCQYPEYPSGCEATAAVMALRYAGETITVAHFIDNYIDYSMDFYWENNVLHGPSPYEYFLGNPRSEQSYGCMAPVIEKALIRHFGSAERVINATGTALSDLCAQYIDEGIPVIIWGGIGMSPILEGRQWTLPDGTAYTWPSGEHCLLLVGYDEDTYYLNDPTKGKTIRYGRWVVEQRYADLGKQALVVK